MGWNGTWSPTPAQNSYGTSVGGYWDYKTGWRNLLLKIAQQTYMRHNLWSFSPAFTRRKLPLLASVVAKSSKNNSKKDGLHFNREELASTLSGKAEELLQTKRRENADKNPAFQLVISAWLTAEDSAHSVHKGDSPQNSLLQHRVYTSNLHTYILII